MPNPYRSELDALYTRCESLQHRLDESAKQAAAQRRRRVELEDRLCELERSRISRAERAEAARRVGRRWLIFGSIAGVAACAVVVLFAHRLSAAGGVGRDPSARAWFKQIRPHCNPVEAHVSVHRSPPPPGAQGTAYLAACYALGGNVEGARVVIDSLPPEVRERAASLIFRLAHPVADAGDDLAAGPLMELVLSYVPDHHIALYHAGMAARERGDLPLARHRLARFLDLYRRDDGWRREAIDALQEVSSR